MTQELGHRTKKTPTAIPGHALYKTGLQRQLGVGTLVSNQERRAFVVPRINRGYTAGQKIPGHALPGHASCESAPHRMRRTRQYPSEPTRPRSRNTHRNILGNRPRVAWFRTYRPRVAWLQTYRPRVAWISGTSSHEDVLGDIRPQMGMIFRTPRLSASTASTAPLRSHGNSVAHQPHLDILRKLAFPMHGWFPRKDFFVVGSALPARGFCVDRRDYSRNWREYVAHTVLCFRVLQACFMSCYVFSASRFSCLSLEDTLRIISALPARGFCSDPRCSLG